MPASRSRAPTRWRRSAPRSAASTAAMTIPSASPPRPRRRRAGPSSPTPRGKATKRSRSTVMQGYTAMIGEALDALSEPPTHIFLQAGVGGIAAAVAAYASQRLGPSAPRIVVVEPERAACLFASAKAGRPVTIPHGEADRHGHARMRDAVADRFRDPAVTCRRICDTAGGRSNRRHEAACGPARRRCGRSFPAKAAAPGWPASLPANAIAQARTHLGLGAHSRILVFNSEGATDPAIYARIVGRTPEEVMEPK